MDINGESAAGPIRIVVCVRRTLEFVACFPLYYVMNINCFFCVIGSLIITLDIQVWNIMQDAKYGVDEDQIGILRLAQNGSFNGYYPLHEVTQLLNYIIIHIHLCMYCIYVRMYVCTLYSRPTLSAHVSLGTNLHGALYSMQFA